MTAPPAPATARRPAAAQYDDHVKLCRATEFGRWCFTCELLVAAADVEDGRRFGWPADEREGGRAC